LKDVSVSLITEHYLSTARRLFALRRIMVQGFLPRNDVSTET